MEAAMKRCTLGALLLMVACATNPYTGRRQLMLIDEGSERQLGDQAYQEVLAKYRVSEDPAAVDPLRRVGHRIAAAAARSDFDWEFNALEDKTVNAFCLPGGKIAFFTGIYPVLQDEAGMAFVMGHEVAHALLRHGAERVSQNMLTGVAGAMLNAYVGSKYPEKAEYVMAAYGVATGVGILLPYSRRHESEADAIGVELMAKAGYDPRASVAVWRRMAAAGGAQPPEFLSTHPSHESRIRDLEARMEGALALYQRSPKAEVARLPAVAPGRGPARAGQAAGLTLSPKACKRTTLADGRKAILFEFTFNRPIFLDSVKIEGPASTDETVPAGIGIPAGAPRVVALARERPGGKDLAPGDYTVVFRGKADGRPFAARAPYDVR